MTKRARIVNEVFQLLSDACDLIKENDQCENCPLKYECLDGRYTEPTVIEIADLINVSTWNDFIEYADRCVPSEALEELMQYADEADYGRDER